MEELQLLINLQGTHIIDEMYQHFPHTQRFYTANRWYRQITKSDEQMRRKLSHIQKKTSSKAVGLNVEEERNWRTHKRHHKHNVIQFQDTRKCNLNYAHYKSTANHVIIITNLRYSTSLTLYRRSEYRLI